jgi:hypothetical protein
VTTANSKKYHSDDRKREKIEQERGKNNDNFKNFKEFFFSEVSSA